MVGPRRASDGASISDTTRANGLSLYHQLLMDRHQIHLLGDLYASVHLYLWSRASEVLLSRVKGSYTTYSILLVIDTSGLMPVSHNFYYTMASIASGVRSIAAGDHSW